LALAVKTWNAIAAMLELWTRWIEGGHEMATTTATRIGFVGLGHMGGNMAARFLAAGYPVYGEDRHREGVQGLVDEGLRWCETPREVAEAAEVVFTSLPDDGVLELVASGTDGILAGLATGKTWVDMSTVSPRASRELAERVRALGAAMLDAPVSGSVPQVQAGTLTIMVGGDEQAYAHVEPLLRELGTPTHIGENGQGLVLKLAINISLAVQMLAFAEGLVLADHAGIDRKLAVDVMTGSPIGSPMLKARAALVLDLPEDAWFDVRLMQKDLVLALDAARQLHVPLPSTAAADELLTVARALGYERRDLAALFKVLGELAGDPV
jgi:3-hydroxyisobutyrate dehydrogenase